MSNFLRVSLYFQKLTMRSLAAAIFTFSFDGVSGSSLRSISLRSVLVEGAVAALWTSCSAVCLKWFKIQTKLQVFDENQINKLSSNFWIL